MPRKTKLPEPKYDFGEIVYRRVESDAQPGIITGYTLRPGGQIIYSVSFVDGESEHFECELTDVKVYGEPVNTEDE